jgi:hypothetical protein
MMFFGVCAALVAGPPVDEQPAIASANPASAARHLRKNERRPDSWSRMKVLLYPTFFAAAPD